MFETTVNEEENDFLIKCLPPRFAVGDEIQCFMEGNWVKGVKIMDRNVYDNECRHLEYACSKGIMCSKDTRRGMDWPDEMPVKNRIRKLIERHAHMVDLHVSSEILPFDLMNLRIIIFVNNVGCF